MEKKKLKRTAASIDRYLRSHRGNVASSPCFHCTIANSTRTRGNATSKPMTVGEFQAMD
jgi:hypothetical protein